MSVKTKAKIKIKTMGIRDLVREGKKIANYGIVDVRDKKTNEYKGVFVSYQYADDVKKVIMAKRKKKVGEMMKLAGIFSGVFGDETVQSIKSKMK